MVVGQVVVAIALLGFRISFDGSFSQPIFSPFTENTTKNYYDHLPLLTHL